MNHYGPYGPSILTLVQTLGMTSLVPSGQVRLKTASLDVAGVRGLTSVLP